MRTALRHRNVLVSEMFSRYDRRRTQYFLTCITLCTQDLIMATVICLMDFVEK